MITETIEITGDTGGLIWQVPVLRFAASAPTGPQVYMQAALHADELPGTAVAHFLCELLRKAEADGELTANVTIVPQANPVGLGQFSSGHIQGRFDLASQVNFNRDFDLISFADRNTLLEEIENQTAVTQLKKRLLYMALQADIVVDLHCDDESLLYSYLAGEFWPDAQDFAACMKLQSVFVSDGHSTAFEEAVAYAWKNDVTGNRPRRMVTTLELRGQMDVDEQRARADAEGLFNFLAGRGVISTPVEPPDNWHGTATLLDHIEIVSTAVSGALLFDANCGDIVRRGDLLARVLTKPGQPNGHVDIFAPQDGKVITRTSSRYAARGQKLFKIACQRPSKTKRPPGALEAR